MTQDPLVPKFDSAAKKVIKKRKYSRAGCEECKRRKMKCDEVKPFCNNCTRLSKSCVYRSKEKYTFDGPDSGSGSGSGSASRTHGTPGAAGAAGTAMTKTTSGSGSGNAANGNAGPMDGPNLGRIGPGLSPINGGGVSGSTGITGDFSVRHYLPINGGYLNNFVTDPQAPGPAPNQSPHAPQPRKPSSVSENSSKHRQSPPRFTNAISDILTPTDSNDYVLNQTDFLEMKHLFDEASLLVSDMNDLQSFDLLNFNSNYDTMSRHLDGTSRHLDNSIANPLVERKLKDLSESPNIKEESRDYGLPYSHFYDGKASSINNTPLQNSGSISGSDSGVKSVSDTFEKHNFRVDEFSKGISVPGDSSMREFDAPLRLSSPVISNSELIEQVIKQHNLNGPHANYLRYLKTEAVSYAFFPFNSSVENNEVVHVLLKYANNCPYLLSALLAMITTIEFNITGKSIHEVSGQKYVSVCLKALSQAFVNNSPNKVNQFLNDIERLLLTVIILTSYFSSKTFKGKDNVLNSWKTHLRGAKDLLINYSLTTKNQSRLHVSSGLALARTWFFAIEALASLTTPLGGTLTRVRNKPDKDSGDKDLATKDDKKFEKSQSVGAMSVDTDECSNDSNNRVFADTGYFDKEHNPEYHDALLNNGLLTTVNSNFNYENYKGSGKQGTRISEFNLFLGFTMEVVYLVQEFAKSMEILRIKSANDPSICLQLPSLRISKLTSLIYNAQMAIIAPLVNLKTFVIPETSPAHPKFPKLDPDRIELPESAYGKFITNENTCIYYSWFDVSQQCHCDAIYLRMLITPGMLQIPKDHPIIRDLVNKILNCLFFILPKTPANLANREDKLMAETENYFISSDLFDHRTFMIQSPYRLVTPLVDDEDTFEKLELFFTGLVKLGNGSATGGLDGLNKRREAVNRALTDGFSDEEKVSLAQTEIVPFS